VATAALTALALSPLPIAMIHSTTSSQPSDASRTWSQLRTSVLP
jgi:hypothetical protein